uniref:Uncharacterized protein n=1 Tax=viral metagenome TaxID=1070528 RepID=A0A6C0EKA8_9ZZZZ
METVGRFCREPSPETFALIPQGIRRMFYIWAIFCKVNSVGDAEVAVHVLQSYNKLLLQANITGRLEMCNEAKIEPAQKISAKLKGQLKSHRIQYLINKYKLNPNTVYFYDDNPEVVMEVKKWTGVNTVLLSKPLVPEDLFVLLRKKKFDKDSVSMVLLDFNHTITESNFRKRWLAKSDQNIIKSHFGGRERVTALFEILRMLEQNGVRLGIITFQTSELVRMILDRLDWITILKQDSV